MNSNPQPLKYPAFFYWGLAGGCFYGMDAAWHAGQSGLDAAAIGAVVLGLLGLKLTLTGFNALDRWRERRKIEKLSRQTSDTHGTAKWATPKGVKKAGMTKGKGLFLGSLKGRDLYYPGETHLMTIAPPGAGKGTSIVIPNLLTYPGSIVVTDPKGELYATTHRAREALGNEVVVLCPWRERMSREMGIEIPDYGWNPLSFVKPGPEIKDEAEMVSSLLLPHSARSNASQEFWTDFGQSILTSFILYLVCRSSRYDLTDLRRELMRPPAELHESLLEASQYENFGGCVAEYAGKLLGTLKNAPETFEGGLSSSQKGLRIYDRSGPLGAHVSEGEFDFQSLKKTPTTVYLIIPSDRIGTHAAWLNLVISLAMETVGRDRSNRRVLFLLDEFANLGCLPNVLRAMAQYRGQGVQVWAIIQQVSQLERLYGREGMHEFFGLSEMINTFGVWEPETVRMISQWMGNRTVKDFSQNITPELNQAQSRFGYQFGASNQSNALLRPEDIRTLPSDEQLIFYRNLSPILAKKVSYLKRRAWRRLADDNPYHRFS